MSCEFCRRADFGSFSAKVDKYSANIYLAGGSGRFPRSEQFNFCPVCGEHLVRMEQGRLEEFKQRLIDSDIHKDVIPQLLEIYERHLQKNTKPDTEGD